MNEEFRAQIVQAIRREEQAYDLYQSLARIVASAETRETLEFLAQEELEHKAFLNKCLSHDGCPLPDQSRDTHEAESLKTPVISQNMTPREALRLAAKQEEQAYHFYKDLAAAQPAGEIKSFMEHMSRMELGHKEKVEYLYNNTAFPEVW